MEFYGEQFIRVNCQILLYRYTIMKFGKFRYGTVCIFLELDLGPALTVFADPATVVLIGMRHMRHLLICAFCKKILFYFFLTRKISLGFTRNCSPRLSSASQ